MGVGTSKGLYFDDDFQHQAGVPVLPKGDEEMVKKPVDTGDDNVLPPAEGAYDQPTKGLTKVFITKPDVHPEPDYMNPPEGNAIQGYVKGLEEDVKSIPDQPAKFMQDMEKSKGKTDDERLDEAISVALGSGIGSINTKNLPYINMFLKQPEFKKLTPELDTFEQAYKDIVESLDGPGAYDKQMADIAAAKKAVKYTGDKVTIPITESGKKIEAGASEYESGSFNSMEEAAEAAKQYGKTNYLDIAIAKKEALENKLSPLDVVNNKIQEIKSRIMNQMLHERAKIHQELAAEKLPKEAIEAGYDTPAYRGLKNRGEIKSEHAFDKNSLMYSSDSSLLADMYTDYLNKHPGWNVKPGAFSEGATVAPLVINTKNYHVYDAKGAEWSSANSKAIAEAKVAGKPGVVVKNVYDEPNSTRALGKPNTVYITFENGASTVKSRFAKKFDKESRNMLHAIPVIGIGGAAGYISKQVDDD